MNYVELIARQTELQNTGMEMQQELHELQKLKYEMSLEHNDLEITEDLGNSVGVSLNMTYLAKDHDIITIKVEDDEVTLTVEDFNKVGGFLQLHGEAIMSYMGEITKVEADVEVAE